MTNLAPWPDFLGQPIRHGDRLMHPADGRTFVAVRLQRQKEHAAWRAIYDDDATVGSLALQIGDKGQASLATAPNAGTPLPAPDATMNPFGEIKFADGRLYYCGGLYLPETLTAIADAPAQQSVYLVATGEVVDGRETYTRHEGAPPPLSDFERLYAAPAQQAGAPELLRGWTRYEKARKLSPIQWADLHARNLAGETFDDMIDALPSPSTPIPAGAPLAEAWIPTADNISALPQPVRDYIHALETNADPAGMVRENAQLKDTNEAVQRLYRRAADALAEVKGCFDAAAAEGLSEALAETQDERLKDLVERRLMYALVAAPAQQAGATLPPAPSEAQLCELEYAQEVLRQIAGGSSVVDDTVERISDIRRARGVAAIAHRRLSAVVDALATPQQATLPASEVEPLMPLPAVQQIIDIVQRIKGGAEHWEGGWSATVPCCDDALLRLQAVSAMWARRNADYAAVVKQCSALATRAQPQADAAGELTALEKAVEAMVGMLEEGEWAEHVSMIHKHPLASRLEDAITALHNELHEAEDDAPQADAAEPVAYYNENWTLTPRAYKEAVELDPSCFADMKPAFAARGQV